MSKKATIRKIAITFDGRETLGHEFDLGADVIVDIDDLCGTIEAAKKAIFDYLNRGDVKKYE